MYPYHGNMLWSVPVRHTMIRLVTLFFLYFQGTAVDDPEQQMTRKPDDNEPLAGLAFKIMADQFQVRLMYALPVCTIRL